MKKKVRDTIINTFLLTVVYIILFQLIIWFTFFISHLFAFNPRQALEVGVIISFGTGATIPIFLGNSHKNNISSHTRKQ